MKHWQRFFFLFILVAAWGCTSDDDNALPDPNYNLVINFMPMFNGNELSLETRYNNVHNCTFLLTDLKFYVSNLTLHSETGDDLLLSEIELIDFRNHHHSLSYNVGGGSYTSLSFDIGVPTHLNGTQNPDFMTSVYDLDHPLGATQGTYWTWQSGYRFFMADGRYDTLPNSTAEILSLFSFHTGRDTLFRSAGNFDRTISRAQGENQVVQLALDFEKYWASSAGEVNLRQENNFHGGPNEMELGHRIANNTALLFRLVP